MTELTTGRISSVIPLNSERRNSAQALFGTRSDLPKICFSLVLSFSNKKKVRKNISKARPKRHRPQIACPYYFGTKWERNGKFSTAKVSKIAAFNQFVYSERKRENRSCATFAKCGTAQPGPL
jgi:hypothetical protein